MSNPFKVGDKVEVVGSGTGKIHTVTVAWQTCPTRMHSHGCIVTDLLVSLGCFPACDFQLKTPAPTPAIVRLPEIPAEAFTLNPIMTVKVPGCECGAAKAIGARPGAVGHSSWCPVK